MLLPRSGRGFTSGRYTAGSNAQPTGAPKRGWCDGSQQFGLLRVPHACEFGRIRFGKNEGQDKRLVNGGNRPRFGGLPVVSAVLVAKVRRLRIERAV